MLMHALKAAATCAALAIYYTPLQTARKIRRDQNVGALSPLPFACIVAKTHCESPPSRNLQYWSATAQQQVWKHTPFGPTIFSCIWPSMHGHNQ